MPRPNPRFLPAIVWIICALSGIIVLLPGQAPARADAPAPVPTQWRIGLTMPPVDPLDPTVDPAALVARHAAPVLTQLAHLRDRGLVRAYRLDAAQHAFAVTTAPGVTAALLPADATVGWVDSAESPLPACAAAQAAALTALPPSAPAPVHSTAARAADPSVHVYVTPTFGSVSGYAGATQSVTLRLLRDGEAVVTRTTTSTGSGYYSFSPVWQSCPRSGYDWYPRAGDIVEVTAASATTRHTVADLRFEVNPSLDLVSGSATPAERVEVWLARRDGGVGNYCLVEFSPPLTFGEEAFSADFSTLGGFTSAAYAYVYAYDADDNYTYGFRDSFSVAVHSNYRTAYGTLPPNRAGTLTIRRGAATVETVAIATDAMGAYHTTYATDLQPGDVLTATAGGASVAYTMARLDVTLAVGSNQLTGTTGPNRSVSAYAYSRTYGYLLTACDYAGSDCLHTKADLVGAFVMPAGIDLRPGDYAYVYSYDVSGNYQIRLATAPVIVADLYYDDVTGYWLPNIDVTVTIEDAIGTLKMSATVTAYADGGFYLYTGIDMVPGDMVIVDDGSTSRTMTVQDLLGGRLSSATDSLSGPAANGRLVADIRDYRRESNTTATLCEDLTVTGNTYNIALSGYDIGGEDYAYVYSSGATGDVTTVVLRAFFVSAEKGGHVVYTYSETPATDVTFRHERGGSTIETINATTSDSAYSYVYFADTILAGDVVRVDTDDGNNAFLVVPDVTAVTDGATQSVNGTAVPNEPVAAVLRRFSGPYSYYQWSRNVTAAGGGAFSASFAGLTWSYHCRPVVVDEPCAVAVAEYHTADGHEIAMPWAAPPAAAADAYEGDDSAATATPYSGPQAHSFHAATDVDWVALGVDSAAINKPFSIRTHDLGWSMGTNLVLYDTDGTTVLASSLGYFNNGAGSSLRWAPAAAGTYYLAVSPPSGAYAAYCDAVYTLTVEVRYDAMLPAVIR